MNRSVDIVILLSSDTVRSTNEILDFENSCLWCCVMSLYG